MKQKETEHNALEPIITIDDIVEIMKCGKKKAAEIMKNPQLHAYREGRDWVCDFEDWAQFRKDLRATGGLYDMSQPMNVYRMAEFISDRLVFVAKPYVTADSIAEAFEYDVDKVNRLFAESSLLNGDGCEDGGYMCKLSDWNNYLSTIAEFGLNNGVQSEVQIDELQYNYPDDLFDKAEYVDLISVIEHLQLIGFSTEEIRRLITYAKETTKGDTL